MRNVNLNILKFLESINNFCLSLANIGLGVSHQLSLISVSFFLPSPHYPISNSHFETILPCFSDLEIR
ncbi:MAG: hypothetical protein EWV85_23845 [Microcystis aeruginosa Ma_QC_C_20070703_M131]|uniref:Uncharacterized protein n=1 Tax=Microcystis aeruginosa Ma_QC_C_20070703_M131 TaxID=2486263 RepID=A0A551X2E1_MICAE|nr:MAG: hypothetical protein EWV85_23845 [Microcystis aeruginosa Ma_QC_C_20070703_M131]